jgi:hypothetical protein
MGLFNNTISNAEVVTRCQTTHEDGNKWSVGKNLEGGIYGLFYGTILALVWKDQRNIVVSSAAAIT